MKKSEMYFKAMCSVVNDHNISVETKLEIVAVLMEDQRIAEYVERQKAEKGE